MADKTPEQEPSIEEILASIRQIISDDDDKDSGNEPASEPEIASPQSIDAMFDAAPPVPVTPEPVKIPEPEPEPEEEDVLELVDAIEDEPELEDDFPEIEEEPPVMSAEIKEEPLLSNSARQSTISSMAKLVGNMPINRPSSYGSVTLEDIVREMLQPMLRDWMNDNLPPMVERIVQKELEKLARRALDE